MEMNYLQCDQMIEKKIRPIGRKSSQKNRRAQKFQNIYIKAQLKINNINIKSLI